MQECSYQLSILIREYYIVHKYTMLNHRTFKRISGDINLHLPQLKSSAAMLVVQQVKIFGCKLSNLHLLYCMITLAMLFLMTLEHWKHPVQLIENILQKQWTIVCLVLMRSTLTICMQVTLEGPWVRQPPTTRETSSLPFFFGSCKLFIFWPFFGLPFLSPL